MNNRVLIWRVATLLLLLAVVVIFVSPAFDMPVSALRAKALAQLITLVLAAIAAIVFGLLPPGFVSISHAPSHDGVPDSAPPLDVSLPLLC